MVNNNGISVWGVIIISLVVAVIASVITTQVTGNPVKVETTTGAFADVYTKSEIDTLSKNINAAACNKDTFCETNYIYTDKILSYYRDSFGKMRSTNLSFIDGNLITQGPGRGGIQFYNEYIKAPLGSGSNIKISNLEVVGTEIPNFPGSFNKPGYIIMYDSTGTSWKCGVSTTGQFSCIRY
ncbi:MAG: hypothetical protein AABX30_01390 [Nanoarchaeota archaeon]